MAEESKINGLAWFVAGLGVGALAGILYAPKSGRETREELLNGAKEGTEYLRNRTRQAAEQVGDLVGTWIADGHSGRSSWSAARTWFPNRPDGCPRPLKPDVKPIRRLRVPKNLRFRSAFLPWPDSGLGGSFWIIRPKPALRQHVAA